MPPTVKVGKVACPKRPINMPPMRKIRKVACPKQTINMPPMRNIKKVACPKQPTSMPPIGKIKMVACEKPEIKNKESKNQINILEHNNDKKARIRNVRKESYAHHYYIIWSNSLLKTDCAIL